MNKPTRKPRRERAPWTDEHTEQLKALHASGMSLSAISKQMDQSTYTISTKAKSFGLSWYGARTKGAESARRHASEYRRQLRAEISLGLLEDAKKLRDELNKPSVVYAFGGRENTYAEAVLDEPTHADKLKIMQSVATALQASSKLEEQETAGVDGATGLLGDLANRLGIDDMKPAGED